MSKTGTAESSNKEYDLAKNISSIYFPCLYMLFYCTDKAHGNGILKNPAHFSHYVRHL